MDELFTPQGVMVWLASLLMAGGLYTQLTREDPLFQAVGGQLMILGLALALNLVSSSYSLLLVPVALLLGLLTLVRLHQERGT